MMRKNLVANHVLVVVWAAVLIGSSAFIYFKNKPETDVINSNDQIFTKTSEPDLYVGWNTYTVPEDPSISFKYPADWNVVHDFHDTVTTPWNRTAIFTPPTDYFSDFFTLNFYYSPGPSNILVKQCERPSNLAYISPSAIKKSEDLTVGSTNLKLLTTESNFEDVAFISMHLVDSSNCTITVPSGSVEMRQGYGVQGLPSHNIDPKTWASIPESAAFNLIFRSLRF